MIAPGTTFQGPLRVSLERIVFTQLEPRNLERVAFYHRLLTQHPDADPGLVMLTPLPADGGPTGFYTLLDGHHRTLAAILAGRKDVLALIQYPPCQETDDEDEIFEANDDILDYPDDEPENEPEPDEAPSKAPQEGDQGICSWGELVYEMTRGELGTPPPRTRETTTRNASPETK